MRFAIFKYAESYDDVGVNEFIKKMPKFIYDMYIQRKNPYTYKKINILESEGFEVTVPFTKELVEELYLKAENLLRRTIDDFYIKDVGIAVIPDSMPFVEGIRKSFGRAIMCFYINDIIKVLLEKQNKDLKDAKILVIDGGNFITNMIINELYENVNYLTFYTSDINNFEEKAEYILSESGLNVNIVQSIKNVAFKEADVIINCAMDMENSDYFFKNGAIYIDIAQNKPKLKRLTERREDMIIVDRAYFKTNEGIFGADIIEAVMFTNNLDMKKFLIREHNQILQKSIKPILMSKDIKLSGFSVLGRDIVI